MRLLRVTDTGEDVTVVEPYAFAVREYVPLGVAVVLVSNGMEYGAAASPAMKVVPR